MLQGRGEVASVAAEACEAVLVVVEHDVVGDVDCAFSVVGEILRDQNSGWLGVVLDESLVRAAAFETVVAVFLNPVAGIGAAMVDVVAASELFGAVWVRFLSLEARVGPVVVKRHRFFDSHRIDEFAGLIVLRGPDAEYPVAYFRTLANQGFAGGQGAEAVERIGGEAVVMSDDVGI